MSLFMYVDYKLWMCVSKKKLKHLFYHRFYFCILKLVSLSRVFSTLNVKISIDVNQLVTDAETNVSA